MDAIVARRWMESTAASPLLSSGACAPVQELSPVALSFPHPASREASAAAAREKFAHFQRRLRLGYSRSGDAHPGRHRIGSRCSAVQRESHEQVRGSVLAQTPKPQRHAATRRRNIASDLADERPKQGLP
jgi:hypothetical protein